MTVSTRVARYPFLDEARDAVDEAVDGFEDLVSDAVLERAEERVVSAIRGSRVGEIADDRRVELFSYPVARAAVSLVDEHVLTRRYAWAESMTALDRFRDDAKRQRGEAFASTTAARVDEEYLLDEFGLDALVTDDGYRVDVADYLALASGMSDEEWKLVNRAVEDGRVLVEEEEVPELAREGVRQRVAEELPLDVPDAVAEQVAPVAEAVRSALDATDLTTDIERVEETEFPPCMKALLGDIREGEHLEHHSRFAITAFLTNIGMSTDEIVDTYEVNPGFGEEMTRYQTDHIKGDSGPVEYTCPSCATMVTYGDCRNKDELCETINHPLGYYRKRLEALDDEEDGLDEGESGDGSDAEEDVGDGGDATSHAEEGDGEDGDAASDAEGGEGDEERGGEAVEPESPGDDGGV